MSGTDGLYSSIQRRAVKEMLRLASSDDKRKIVRAFQVAERITPEQHKASVRFVGSRIQDDHPALQMARHVATRLNPRCRDAFIECLIVNTLLRGAAKRRELNERTGMVAPTTILMSPTMRCNLACEGCYAAEYSARQDLDRDLLQRIVDEGNDMGVYTFTVLGGEPFIYGDLIDLARANRDAYFQVFTNGTLLDGETVDEIAAVGNIAPMLSVEGAPEMTDYRRGRGVHQQVMEAADRLGEAGVPFGYSATVTRSNWRLLISDEFVDSLIAKGAMIAWHFMYMPLGRDPDTHMMLTPQDREEFRLGINRLRSEKPFFPVDFWGDAPWVGGCIAGRHYMHINAEGWVEPCIFTHFATDNIHEVSLLEAFNSPYFQEIRSRQPFNHNLLMPCMWIDNPQCSREIMSVSGAHPTHDGADVMLTDLDEELDDYSAEARRVFDRPWREMCMKDQPEDASAASQPAEQPSPTSPPPEEGDPDASQPPEPAGLAGHAPR